jgi:putative ABC transport system substrate-binding protein
MSKDSIMREGRVMDWLKYPFFLFVLVVTPLSGAKNISVVVSPSSSEMAVEHIQLGMKKELNRQGYVRDSNLTWLNEAQTQWSDLRVTITSAKESAFLTLISQSNRLTPSASEHWPIGVTSVSPMLPGAREFNFLNELLPDIRTLGVIINKEVDDIENVQHFLTQQERKGIRIVYRYITTGEDLRHSTRSLVPLVDAIYLPCHITKMAQLNQVVTVAERNNVALIGEDHMSIHDGILAVYDIDYVQVGSDTADLLVRLAEGEDRRDIHNFIAQPVLSINLDTASRTGIELPSGIIDKAKFLIE